MPSASLWLMPEVCGYDLLAGVWVHLQVGFAPLVARCYRPASGRPASRSSGEASSP
jgi:hypothetical protein